MIQGVFLLQNEQINFFCCWRGREIRSSVDLSLDNVTGQKSINLDCKAVFDRVQILTATSYSAIKSDQSWKESSNFQP